MNTRMTIVLGMLFLLPSLSFTTVSAQYMFSTNPFNNPLNNMLQTMIDGKINEKMLQESVANQKKSGGSKSTATRTITQPAVPRAKSPAEVDKIVTFHPTAQPLKAREIANMLGSTQEEKDQTLGVFIGLLKYFDGEAKRLGKPNDFPLALSVFLAVNSAVYHQTSDPDDAHIMRLRDIIADSMADDPHFAAVTDRSKQELYETMVVFTLFTRTSYDEAQKAGNRELMEGYRKFAGKNLQNFCNKSPDELKF